MLYNSCWHGFWVRSWWPRVLWQAVTLWLANSGMAVRLGRPVEQVCNRKETTWYENHVLRFRQSGSQNRESSQGYAADRRRLRRLWRYGLQVGANVGTPGSRKKIWDKKKSPLWVCVSPSISQSYNKLCAHFENKMREIYFYKEVCFVRSLKFVRYLWLCSWLGLWEVYNKMTLFRGKKYSYIFEYNV